MGILDPLKNMDSFGYVAPKALVGIKNITMQMIYPDKALEDNLEGKVMVSFVVDKVGKVKDVKVKKSISPELDKEAIRVVKGMPLWKPGMQAGIPQNVQLYLPILFKLNQ